MLPNAVRELLRYDTPVQWSGRRVTAYFMLQGQRVRRGELVIALIGSANRDPARHEAPDRLDMARANPGALSFGTGLHVCLGPSLTQMEAQTVLWAPCFGAGRGCSCAEPGNACRARCTAASPACR